MSSLNLLRTDYNGYYESGFAKKCLSHILEDLCYCLSKAERKWHYVQSFAKIILTPLYFCFSTFSYFNTDFSWWIQWDLCSILFLFILYQNTQL